MDLQAYKDEIIIKLGGGVLESVEKDLGNGTLDKLIQSSLRECQSYLNITKFVTVPYANCIQMDDGKISSAVINTGQAVLSIVDVLRAQTSILGLGNSQSGGIPDPLYLAMTTMSGGGTGGMAMGAFTEGYTALMQWRQVANTITTDLRWQFDSTTNKLYVNAPYPRPASITIQYIPRLKLEEIQDPFWEDIIAQMSLANAKIALGRVRGRYNLGNALWSQDAEQLLSEGTTELADLRAYLRDNCDTNVLVY